jgi:hypothetical protein
VTGSPCICGWRLERGCPVHGSGAPSLASIQSLLELILRNQEKQMTALDNLNAADDALKTEVVTILADIQTALTAEDPDVQGVADSINAQIAALQAGDPVPPAAQTSPPAAPPADGSTPPADVPPADGGSAS